MAVRVNSIDILYNLKDRYNWISEELTQSPGRIFAKRWYGSDAKPGERS